MRLNELDRSRYWSPVEPDLGSSTPRSIGKKVASGIQKALLTRRSNLPTNSRYLGLAAGQAYAEHTVATILGIGSNNITLVDRQFAPSVLERFRNEHSETEVIESGLFAYLDAPTQTDFSVVTALGIEYVLSDETSMRALITGTRKLLSPGGFVCVFPYFGRDMRRMWVQQGFEEIHGYHGNASILLYKLSDMAQ